MNTSIIRIDGYDYEPQEVEFDAYGSAWRDSVGRRMSDKADPLARDFNTQLKYFAESVEKFTSLGDAKFEYKSMGNEIERCEA